MTGDSTEMPNHLLTPDSVFDPNTQAVVACLTAGLDDQLRRLKESVTGMSVEIRHQLLDAGVVPETA